MSLGQGLPFSACLCHLGLGVGASQAPAPAHNARNLLALGWVTPEGEIVRMLVAPAVDWDGLPADGPGPGFRGV